MIRDPHIHDLPALLKVKVVFDTAFSSAKLLKTTCTFNSLHLSCLLAQYLKIRHLKYFKLPYYNTSLKKNMETTCTYIIYVYLCMEVEVPNIIVLLTTNCVFTLKTVELA